MAASVVKWIIVAIILGRVSNGGSYNHPFYVSVTEITHNAASKTLEISCKIFTNDFESALEKSFHSKVDLQNMKDKAASDKIIADYIGKHLQIKVDGKSQQIHFVGSENQQEATWSYFQADDVTTVRQMDIQNTILYDSFESEINIMHVTVSGKRKSLEVTNPNSNASFDFVSHL